jgi:hypothetical protein
MHQAWLNNKKNGDGMAQRMLGGIPGDEDEKPEVEAPDALIGAEAFDRISRPGIFSD